MPKPGARKAAKPADAGEPAVPIVGVGASAGGVEAFTQLLQALPTDAGMAFVLISHLSHTHKSLLTEILSKATRMPVTELKRKTVVEANHVYVIPPNSDLGLGNGTITARPASKVRKPHMAIDHFLRSLAEHRKSRAIGAILSGTGTDGTLGLAAIRAEGGITFAQDEKSAKYPDMPRSASAGIGGADFVLPPDGIARELSRIARHPYVAREAAAVAPSVTQRADIEQQIFRVVRAATGIDFSQYKSATINRRISRRMVLHKIDRLPDYLKRLQGDPSEVQALAQDLLINVTGFFRDPETFEYLKKDVFCQIIKQSGDGPVRVWVPACATGEEVYSLAICLLEALGDFGISPSLQIFATDVARTAIQKAREGAYPENIAQDVSAERLRRFFIKTDKGYEIGKLVRDLCVFAVQNVLRDPPFSQVDLISCRNLLIYLEPDLQQKVLATFHYALNASGCLLLGSSETLGTSSDLFHEISKKHRIYRKLPSAVAPRVSMIAGEGAETPAFFPEMPFLKTAREAPNVKREADRILLERYTPSGVIVNPAMEIVEFCGEPAKFMAPAKGKASLNLFRMVRQSVVVDLRAAIHQAAKSGATVRKEHIPLESGDVVTAFNLAVVPLKGEAAAGHFLVLFEDHAATEKRAAEQPAPAALKPAKGKLTDHARENRRLRSELASVQEHLHSIIEDQEATNEELQSANEEILSSNEELQSINEELETAKEELQATNEELHTVNEELHHRNEEMTGANDDLNNLIESMDIVYLILDSDLRIRRFTPAAKKLFNLIPSDMGRPIDDIRSNIQVPGLTEIIAGVIDAISVTEQEVQDCEGRWYHMKIRPYKTRDNRIAGAVLALTEIDHLKRTQEALRESEASIRTLLEEAPDFILSADSDGRVLFINRTLASLAKQAVVGESIYDYLEPKDHKTIRRCLAQVRSTGEVARFETQGIGPLRATKRYVTRVGALKSAGKIVALTLITGLTPAKRERQK